MGFSALGKNWTPAEFDAYLKTIPKPLWATSVTLHHAASPSLSDRPSGFSAQHMINLKDFYADTKGWHTGPHLFTDDRLIHGLTALSEAGTHARSFNAHSIGIETLGDYDRGNDDPKSGRGLACWKVSAAATVSLLKWLGLPVNAKTILFHREDPLTTKSCPGERVTKEWVLELCGAVINDELPSSTDVGNSDPTKPADAGDWSIWKLQAGTVWCVPVVDFLVGVFGYNSGNVSSNLSKVNGVTSLFGSRLEHAYYEDGKTWAGARELIALAKAKKKE